MTVDEFIRYVERFYGEYKNIWVRDSLIKYLKHDWIYPSDIEKLYKKLIRYFSYTKRIPPDISIMEQVDKLYGIRQYINGYRQIPEADRKKQITQKEEEGDYLEELKEMWKNIKEKNEEKMKKVKPKNKNEIMLKVENINGTNHAPGHSGNDCTLCGLVTSGDSGLGIPESKLIEGKITCKDCLGIIKYCLGLKI